MSIAVHWFRRDLRLEDNAALYHALVNHHQVLPVFIFDENIIDELPRDDARISFIYQALVQIEKDLKDKGKGLKILKGKPVSIWQELISEYDISDVYTNKDYEPYAIDRDKKVKQLLKKKGVAFHTFKDQVMFEEGEVVKNDGSPYTVYSPYSKKWLLCLNSSNIERFSSETHLHKLIKIEGNIIPTMKEIGFIKSKIQVPDYEISNSLIAGYAKNRDFPIKEGTSRLAPHLRFGRVSIRNIIREVSLQDITFLKELIWREFFMQILYHFPQVVHQSFKMKYDNIKWNNNEKHFQLWCAGKTGYPIVDAGIRELNATGCMHNRVRMVVASFLCKHLLIDWRWGEAYFAGKLLDYELSSNNGNWQWAAGCGCDAAPYFRVFNPYTQQQKFDPEFEYVKKWVPEFDTIEYSKPIVDHRVARMETIRRYKESITTL